MDIKTAGIVLVTFILGFFAATLLDQKNHQQEPVESDAMHHAMADMTSGLQGKAGDAFDKAFLEEMIMHHEGAIEMAEMLLANTRRPELKMLGENIISAQKGEVEIMKGWLGSWY